jgi:hypothetical protein
MIRTISPVEGATGTKRGKRTPITMSALLHGTFFAARRFQHIRRMPADFLSAS